MYMYICVCVYINMCVGDTYGQEAAARVGPSAAAAVGVPSPSPPPPLFPPAYSVNTPRID